MKIFSLEEQLENQREELANNLSRDFPGIEFIKSRNFYTIVGSLERLTPLLKSLKDKYGFISLLDIAAVDNLELSSKSERFSVFYLLLNMEVHQRIQLEIRIDEEKIIPSITSFWESANWYESEIFDLFGIQFSSKKDRIFTSNEIEGNPLKKDFKNESRINLEGKRDFHFEHDLKLEKYLRDQKKVKSVSLLSLSDPSRSKIICETVGDEIIRSKVFLGFQHRGVEKTVESKTYEQISLYVERLNFQSSHLNQVGWILALEEILQIVPSDKTKAIRMIVIELSRISDHLTCIGQMCFETGLYNIYHQTIEARESILELFKRFSGRKVFSNLCRVGGMVRDLPSGWITECLEVIKETIRSVDDISNFLTQSNMWTTKTRLYSITAQDAISWGYSGPCLRACGVNYDLRKVTPYLFYQDVDFEIPLGINGDSYDRYLVRLEEIRQSIKIITQVLDNLPSGHVRPIDIENIRFGKGYQSLSKNSGNITLPEGAYYHSTESANGELGYFIISDGKASCPYRVKIRTPSFPLLQSFEFSSKGTSFEDCPVGIVSMNAIHSELER